MTPDPTTYLAKLDERIADYQRLAESDGLDSPNFNIAAGLAEAKQIFMEMQK